MARRIGLLGCVKEKRTVEAPSEDLYTSPLFLGRRRFVERSCDEWWILSAAHGLVNPRTILAPYDVTLKKAPRTEKRRWTANVLQDLDSRIGPDAGDVFELHAGAEYRDFGLVEGLLQRGCIVENPTARMAIGTQLRFYKEQQSA